MEFAFMASSTLSRSGVRSSNLVGQQLSYSLLNTKSDNQTTMKNPPWVREEAILLLDLYMQCGRHLLPPTDERVIALSELLRRLPFHPPEKRAGSFRNPTGISMKLGNLLALDPCHDGVGLDSASTMDRQVWEKYAEEPDALRNAAQAIRTSVRPT